MLPYLECWYWGLVSVLGSVRTARTMWSLITDQLETDRLLRVQLQVDRPSSSRHQCPASPGETCRVQQFSTFPSAEEASQTVSRQRGRSSPSWCPSCRSSWPGLSYQLSGHFQVCRDDLHHLRRRGQHQQQVRSVTLDLVSLVSQTTWRSVTAFQAQLQQQQQ